MKKYPIKGSAPDHARCRKRVGVGPHAQEGKEKSRRISAGSWDWREDQSAASEKKRASCEALKNSGRNVQTFSEPIPSPVTRPPVERAHVLIEQEKRQLSFIPRKQLQKM